MDRELAEIGARAVPEKAPHFDDVVQKFGNVQDMAARLEAGLRDLADRLLGEDPKVQTGEKLREVGYSCGGVVGELFERTQNLDDRLRASLRELDRLA